MASASCGSYRMLAWAWAGVVLPVEEHGNDVPDQGREQGDRQRHMDVQPDFHDRLILDVARHTRRQAALAREDVDELAQGFRLLVVGATGQKVDHGDD